MKATRTSSSISIMWLLALAMFPAGVAAQGNWYDGLPHVSFVTPNAGTNCMNAVEIEHSSSFDVQAGDSPFGRICPVLFYMDACPEWVDGEVTVLIPATVLGIPVATAYVTVGMEGQQCPLNGIDLCVFDTPSIDMSIWQYIVPNSNIHVINNFNYVETVIQISNSQESRKLYILLYLDGLFASNNAGAPIYMRVQPGLPCEECPVCRECEECLPAFTPQVGKMYKVNAWTKEESAPLSTVTYAAPYLSLNSLDQAGQVIESTEVTPSGPIIDGWQRMEGTFMMDPAATQFQVLFGTYSGPVYFDDIRIVPADGSMTSYVYDQDKQRFVAELDERHFATFYEYDNEGRLVRTKKETERGIMTILERRESGHHTGGQ